MTTLLALPRQKGKHSGYNLSETVSDIIAEYSLQDKLGYFTTDNAPSNETCLRYIGDEHSFDYKPKWLRCSGHVFNLVGQAALLGHDSDAFSRELENVTLEELELATWRKKGPIGKLHNVIYWTLRSPQRCERLEAIQLELITPFRPDGKKEVYHLVRDVETRWNSFDDSAERALYLQVAIDELMLKEKVEYDEYVQRCQRTKRPVKQKAPAILQDALDADDWNVIKIYHEILQPLKEATMLLQGHAGGNFGAIWQVIPTFEKVLKHFETLVDQYPVSKLLQAPTTLLPSQLTFDTNLTLTATAISSVPDEQTTYEHHLSTNINLAWQKMNGYYAHLDDTPAYVAAVVLHPRMKWRYLEKRWSDKICSHKQPCHKTQCNNWIQSARNRFNELCVEYRDCKVNNLQAPKPPPSPKQPSPKRRKRADHYFSDDELSDSETQAYTIEHQLAEYLREPRRADMTIVSSPIEYWIHNRSKWPQLAALALDIYAAAVMSDEPERVFSMTGAAVSSRRRLLDDTTVRDIMCLKAWIDAGIITIDRYPANLPPCYCHSLTATIGSFSAAFTLPRHLPLTLLSPLNHLRRVVHSQTT